MILEKLCCSKRAVLYITGGIFIVGLMLWLLLSVMFSVGREGSALPGYRLPEDIKPVHYDLSLVSDLESFTFSGDVTIKIHCYKATHSIILHSNQLKIVDGSISVKELNNGSEGSALNVVSNRDVPENFFHIIKVEQSLKPNKQYVVHIPFNGALTQSLDGYYRSSYFDKASNETKWLGVTQFESSDARKAFPCFDEPEMKARFSIKLGHKEHLKSISNMPRAKLEPMVGRKGWVWSIFEESVPMSTYLVAWLVSEFEHKVAPPLPNNVTFRIWARKEAIQQVELASEVGPKVLSFFEELFDIKYPLPKQDMAAIPDFSAGAMENWGLITYRETDLLYDARVSAVNNKERVAYVISHELAHQWFGNLVTMKWWTDLWLNEGFATYVGGLGVEHVFPEWNFVATSVVDNMGSVFELDSLKSSHKISIKVGKPSEVQEIFDAISYKKGSSIIRMMHKFLGNSFAVGVSHYLKQHEYGNAEQDDLWEALTEQAYRDGVMSQDVNVKEVMESWTLQTGYPLLTVTRDYEKGTVTVTQKRFLKIPDKTKENSCWWVPITYTTQGEANFNSTMPNTWMTCPDNKPLVIEGLPKGKDQWIIFNIELAALARILYDDNNWQLIINTLNSDKFKTIAPINRAALIMDAFEFAKRGDVPYELAFKLSSYLSRETEYIPFSQGVLALSSISSLMKRTSGYGIFRKYMKQLIGPLFEKYNKLSEVPSTLEQIKIQQLAVSWACKLEIGDCNTQALELYNKWENTKDKDNNNPIPVDLRKLVLCTAVRMGGQKVWDYLWERYKVSNFAAEKNNILGALACSREVWIINRYLEWSIDENIIRRQDSTYIFASVIGQETGYYIARDFLHRRIKDIYKLHESRLVTLGKYLSSYANKIVFNHELEELKLFINENKEYFKGAKLAMDQSLENANANVKWHEKNYETISKMLAF